MGNGKFIAETDSCFIKEVKQSFVLKVLKNRNVLKKRLFLTFSQLLHLIGNIASKISEK